MDQNKKTNKQRKRYEKPEATRFPLRPEEAVLGFCKTSGSGPHGGACGNPPGGCPSAGS
jgi:hypothetical protein